MPLLKSLAGTAFELACIAVFGGAVALWSVILTGGY